MVAFTEDIADRICEELQKGRTLRSVCRDDGMPSPNAVLDWAEKEPFASRYTRARMRGYEVMAEEILEISDDTKRVDYNRDRLRVDTRKWLLSKCLPKIYGDKLALGGADGGPLQVSIVKFADDEPPTDEK